MSENPIRGDLIGTKCQILCSSRQTSACWSRICAKANCKGSKAVGLLCVGILFEKQEHIFILLIPCKILFRQWKKYKFT